MFKAAATRRTMLRHEVRQLARRRLIPEEAKHH